jgi:two-component system, NarL family, sensor histidine kinase UhpB
VLSAAAVLLAVTPATISSPLAESEALVLVLGTGCVIALNGLAMHRALAPLSWLAEQMETIDPLEPGAVTLGTSAVPEVYALTSAFDAMVLRLRKERRDSAHSAMRAEEAERDRIARELHDDVGQSLTVLLLELARARRSGSDAALTEAQATARRVLQDVRQICHQLRPESLDDLGLGSALMTLATRVSEAAQLPVDVTVDPELPPLSAAAELAVLRVAQEGLTNVVRHAGASRARLSLTAADGGVSLRITDDGNGLAGAVAPGGGIRGMRERAMGVGGRLTLEPAGVAGVEVRLDIVPEQVAA